MHRSTGPLSRKLLAVFVYFLPRSMRVVSGRFCQTRVEFDQLEHNSKPCVRQIESHYNFMLNFVCLFKNSTNFFLVFKTFCMVGSADPFVVIKAIFFQTQIYKAFWYRSNWWTIFFTLLLVCDCILGLMRQNIWENVVVESETLDHDPLLLP